MTQYATGSIGPDTTATNWKALIDEFATQLMIHGGGSDAVEQLHLLSQRAEAEQAGRCAAVFASLLARVAGDAQTGVAYLLQHGIVELQDSVEPERSTPSAAIAHASLGDDAELVADFVVEAREHLSQIEGQMLILERDPTEMEVIHAVFRAFHTIKGLAGFLDFGTVQAVAHEVETLLDLARNEKLVVNSPIVDVVLESGDFLLTELASIERALTGDGTLLVADHSALAKKIRDLAQPKAVATSVALPSPTPLAHVATETISEPPPELFFEPTPSPAFERVDPPSQSTFSNSAISGQNAASSVQSPLAQPPPTSTPLDIAGQTIVAPDGKGFIKLFSAADRAAMLAEAQSGPVPNQAPTNVPTAPSPTIVDLQTTRSTPPDALAASPVPHPEKPALPVTVFRPPATKEPSRSPDASSVRVETAKLDHLMDMVGEIVIAQSLIRHNQAFSAATDSRLLGDLAQLARVTGEVQRATMSMRMIPVGNVFQRVERVIRDLSRKAGKQVVLDTAGSETEIDKTVAEELSDPLLHMVRNSVDHGIETPSERVAAGKPAEARIKLSARHQGGLVIIEITDDGRGLNSEKIRRKAEERNLIAPNAQLSETEIFELIFAPGFSTAEKITDVSGRGVGMDVVRRNVEKLRGRIETQSVLGEGTSFSLKLPLTLAIIDGLVVEVGAERYIIPLSGVREIFKPNSDALFTVEGRDEMLLVRGKLLPIVRLAQRLGIEGFAHAPSEGLIVVMESHNRCFCLLVDDLLGKQEVVIKSLGEAFKDVSGLSGCAVLGDGRVGLILDIDGIYRGGR